MNHFRILCLILINLLCINLSAQKFLSKEWLEDNNERKAKKVEEGRLLIMPLAGPAYTPELGFTIAGGVMTSFKTNRNDSLIQRSSAPIMLGITSTGAYFFNTKLTSFWFQDQLRIYGDINFKSMPDNYWGVGYDAAYYTPKSDSTTAYDRLWWQINPKFLWQFEENYFGGLIIDYNYTKGSSASQGVMDDPYYQQFNDKPLNGGLGIVFQYDSRDVPVTAWSGLFLEGSATAYGNWLGGQNNYQIYVADIRKYWTLNKKPGRTLAIQAKGRFGRGDVPYGEMSQLGTPFDLRGYIWGQYRNNTMVYGIAEYRHMFYKKSGDMSKHGAVAWVGAGTIGHNITEFEKYLPNFGLGYRLEVQPRMNLRIDVGLGRETAGFYFNFNEAF